MSNISNTSDKTTTTKRYKYKAASQNEQIIY